MNLNHSKLYQLVLISTLALAPLAASASLFPVNKKSYMKFEYNTYQYTRLDDPRPNETEGRIYSDELNAELGGRWQTGHPRSYIQSRLLTGWLNLDFADFDGSTEPRIRFDRMNNIDLELLYRGYWKSPLGIQLQIQPGSAAQAYDKNLWEEGLTLRGGAWAMWYIDKDWTSGLGAIHTYNFGEPMVLPSLLVEYRNEKSRWRGRAALPLDAEAWYRHNKTAEFGVVYSVTGNYYAREKNEFPGVNDPFVGHSVASLSLAVGLDLDETLRFQIELGTVFEHRLRLYDGTNEVESARSDLEGREMLRISMMWGGDRSEK